MNKWIIAALASCVAAAAQAETLNVQMNAVGADGVGKAVGQVSIETSDYGLVFRPQLSDLQPGVHGFHIHAKGSCETAEIDGKTTPAGAAGGHWDPKNTGKHGEPWATAIWRPAGALRRERRHSQAAGARTATQEPRRHQGPGSDGAPGRRQPCRPSATAGRRRCPRCLRFDQVSPARGRRTPASPSCDQASRRRSGGIGRSFSGAGRRALPAWY